MQPRTRITIQNNALGILPPQFGSLVALTGYASGGTPNQPYTFGTVKSLEGALIDGPLVEAAAHVIERYGNPVVCIPTAASTAAVVGAPVFDGSGTSVPAAAADVPGPVNDLEIFIAVVDSEGTNTIGTDDITVQYSLDNGRNMSGNILLPATGIFPVPGSGVTVTFAAGTLLVGDTTYVKVDAPQWSGTELADAVEALSLSKVNWDILEIVGELVPTNVVTLETKFAGLAAAGKFRMYVGSAALPDVGETDAAYQATLQAAWANTATVYGSITAGATLMVSSLTGQIFLRPVSYVFAPWLAHLSEEQDAAALIYGPLPCTVYDDNGNLVDRCHDETIYPGLDDMRFTVLRSWTSYAGTYVNNPRMMSPEGSDFKYCQARRVINIAAAVLQRYFDLRLSVAVAVDSKTGKILEEEAKEMESGAVAAMAAALTAKPKASAVSCVVSRDDNILSTELINVTARVTPLGYPKAIEIDLAFDNPAANTALAS